jgi:acetyl-CoA carboxylase carboxyl transferase subunit alpha
LAAFWAAPAAESQTSGRTVTGTERLRFLRRRGADGDAWHAVELARHQDRPYTLDYLARFCDDFVELHGDRAEGDDPAIVSGLGSFRGQTVAFVGHQKGRDLKQRAYRNFGMPRPEGYRKAMRVFELAGRLGFPVVTLIDTPGAYPGVGAEQRGQSGAIARSQLLLMGLNVPVVACVIGEGSSGGALAIGVADRVLMQQHTIYTVISPEGCAAILWKDAGEAKRAATALRPTAPACLALGVIDQIVPEPGGGAHRDHAKAADMLGDAIAAELEFLDTLPPLERRRLRRQKFERMGAFLE